jgi:RNA polymerase sigma-70 factor (ECF subfamily)
MIDAVRQAILALPAHYREVVVLCSLHEMNYEQAAEAIGCPVGTVRSRLHRARAMLIDKLRDWGKVESAPRDMLPARCAL